MEEQARWWTVTASSEPLPDEKLWDELQEKLLDRLEAWRDRPDIFRFVNYVPKVKKIEGVVGWTHGRRLGAVFSLQAESLGQAAWRGAEIFRVALQLAQAPVTATRVEVEPFKEDGEDEELELERRARIGGQRVEVLTASEVGKILGVSRQRVYQLLDEHEDFPRPVAILPRGAVWNRISVEQWRRAWPRRPGRPSRPALERDGR